MTKNMQILVNNDRRHFDFMCLVAIEQTLQRQEVGRGSGMGVTMGFQE